MFDDDLEVSVIAHQPLHRPAGRNAKYKLVRVHHRYAIEAGSLLPGHLRMAHSARRRLFEVRYLG
jgi:hypothetical protein